MFLLSYFYVYVCLWVYIYLFFLLLASFMLRIPLSPAASCRIIIYYPGHTKYHPTNLSTFIKKADEYRPCISLNYSLHINDHPYFVAEPEKKDKTRKMKRKRRNIPRHPPWPGTNEAHERVLKRSEQDLEASDEPHNRRSEPQQCRQWNGS